MRSVARFVTKQGSGNTNEVTVARRVTLHHVNRALEMEKSTSQFALSSYRSHKNCSYFTMTDFHSRFTPVINFIK